MKLTPNPEPTQPPDQFSSLLPSLESPLENLSAKTANADAAAVPYIIDVDWFPTRRKSLSTAVTHEGMPAFSAQHPEQVVAWVLENGGTVTHVLLGEWAVRVAEITPDTELEVRTWPRPQHPSYRSEPADS